MYETNAEQLKSKEKQVKLSDVPNHRDKASALKEAVRPWPRPGLGDSES